MNKFKTLSCAAAIALGALLAVSCHKDSSPKEVILELQVTDITSSGATVSVTQTSGDTPYLVRLLPYAVAETVTGAVSLEDQAAVASYIYSNGSAIAIPYTAQLTGLDPAQGYVTGVVAFDSDLQVVACVTAEFQTAIPDNAIGDAGGAGTIGNVEL